MSVLDQSFSAKNFEVIFNMLNRMGKMKITKMSEDYQKTITDIKETRDKMRILRRKKNIDWTAYEKDDYELYDEILIELGLKKTDALCANMQKIADEVNRTGFRFTMSKHIYEAHDEFTIDTTNLSADYAIYQLQHNLKKTFKVEMTSRHDIMLSIKRLLNTKTPLYIIRTDVSSFFESIPQDKLFRKINDNSLLSYKSKSFIGAIIQDFEKTKDTKKIPKGVGIPRGVGISSYLSEIYMQDIDRQIKSRKEVIFYVRYVDDIFMIMSSIHPNENIEKYYSELGNIFINNGLNLKNATDTKCKLIDYVKLKPINCEFEYLGYLIKLFYDTENKKLNTKYGLSKNKKDKIIARIDKAFFHFENLSKVNIKQARKDLLDSLRLITGNVHLHNSKSGVKVGLYYNNDLLDDIGLKDLHSLTCKLHHKFINVHTNTFLDTIQKEAFVKKLQKRINKIDLRTCWECKKMYNFPVSRITEIMKWL